MPEKKRKKKNIKPIGELPSVKSVFADPLLGVEETTNEGLNLEKKKYPDKYFDKYGNEVESDYYPIDHINSYNQQGEIIARDYEDGRWEKWEVDNKGNGIYYESSEGYWCKWEYNADEEEIYYENSDGYWVKKEYDDRGNNTYFENASGYWEKWEYNTNNKLIYRETSEIGITLDLRNKPLDEGLNLFKQPCYFIIFICGEYENEDRDECFSGYKIYLKIPKEQINDNDISPNGAFYYVGEHRWQPIIQWAINNNQINSSDIGNIIWIAQMNREQYDERLADNLTDDLESEINEIGGGLSDTLGQNDLPQVPKWESGINRSHANPIDFSKPWVSNMGRGHANSLFEALNLLKKQHQPKYFDWDNNEEFPVSELSQHPKWVKHEYDNKGNNIKSKWWNETYTDWERDKNGSIIYNKNTNLDEGLNLFKKGFTYFDYNTHREFDLQDIKQHPKWYKHRQNIDGYTIYYEDFKGFWQKWGRDKNNRCVYYENSDGVIEDDRDKQLREGLNLFKKKIIINDGEYQLSRNEAIEQLSNLGMDNYDFTIMTNKELIDCWDIFGVNNFLNHFPKFKLNEGLNLFKKSDVEPAIFKYLDEVIQRVEKENVPNMGNNVFRLYAGNDYRSFIMRMLVYPSGKVSILHYKISFIANICERFNISRDNFNELFDVWFKDRYGNEIIKEGLNLVKKKFKYFDSDTDREFPASDIKFHSHWYRDEHDADGKLRYREYSDSVWYKFEHDADGKLTYRECSDGRWWKWEYNDWGEEIYYADHNGTINDRRTEPLDEGLNLFKKPRGITKFPDDFRGEGISHGTMNPNDLIPTFLGLLYNFEWDYPIQEKVDKLSDDWTLIQNKEENWPADTDDEEKQYILDDLFNLIYQLSPDGTSFGPSEGDGSNYGFWTYYNLECPECGNELDYSDINYTNETGHCRNCNNEFEMSTD